MKIEVCYTVHGVFNDPMPVKSSRPNADAKDITKAVDYVAKHKAAAAHFYTNSAETVIYSTYDGRINVEMHMAENSTDVLMPLEVRDVKKMLKGFLKVEQEAAA